MRVNKSEANSPEKSKGALRELRSVHGWKRPKLDDISEAYNARLNTW